MITDFRFLRRALNAPRPLSGAALKIVFEAFMDGRSELATCRYLGLDPRKLHRLFAGSQTAGVSQRTLLLMMIGASLERAGYARLRLAAKRAKYHRLDHDELVDLYEEWRAGRDKQVAAEMLGIADRTLRYMLRERRSTVMTQRALLLAMLAISPHGPGQWRAP